MQTAEAPVTTTALGRLVVARETLQALEAVAVYRPPGLLDVRATSIDNCRECIPADTVRFSLVWLCEPVHVPAGGTAGPDWCSIWDTVSIDSTRHDSRTRRTQTGLILFHSALRKIVPCPVALDAVATEAHTLTLLRSMTSAGAATLASVLPMCSTLQETLVVRDEHAAAQLRMRTMFVQLQHRVCVSWGMRPAAAAPPASGAASGATPQRWPRHVASVVPRRVVNGAFEYCLQHRAAEVWEGKPAPGSYQLGLIGGSADPHVIDGGLPWMTAYRECAEEAGLPTATVSPSKFLACVAHWIDDVPTSRNHRRDAFSDGGQPTVYTARKPQLLTAHCLNDSPSVTCSDSVRRLACARVVHSNHQVFVLDVGPLMPGAAWKPDARNSTHAHECATDVWPSGYVWVSETVLRAAVAASVAPASAPAPAPAPVPAPVTVQSVHLRPETVMFFARNAPVLLPCRTGNMGIAYHGTSEQCAHAIQTTGFRTDLPVVARMLGAGVYVAEAGFAWRFALLRTNMHPHEGRPCLVEVLVDLGYCHRLAPDTPCACTRGCTRTGVDHTAKWRTRHAADSCCTGREWVVADPSRCTVLRLLFDPPTVSAEDMRGYVGEVASGGKDGLRVTQTAH